MTFISRKVDYAILVLFHLMQHADGASAREVADRYGLSRAFIATILKQLGAAGLVESHGGVHGGYRLARDAGAVTLRDVMAALDGPFHLTECSGEAQCGLEGICPVRHPLRAVHERLVAVLGGVTL